jgi:hypothetical protein
MDFERRELDFLLRIDVSWHMGGKERRLTMFKRGMIHSCIERSSQMLRGKESKLVSKKRNVVEGGEKS